MAAVRVTRILEYVYEDAQHAIEDMERWTVPARGSLKFGRGNRITVVRSAVIGPVFGESWELDIDAKETPDPGAP